MDADERQRRQRERDPREGEEQLAIAARHRHIMANDAAELRRLLYLAPSMVRARWLHIALLVAAIVAFGTVLYVPGLETGVLFLSPAIVLLASLLTGRYVGEGQIARLAGRDALRPPPAPPAGRAHPASPLRGRMLMPRGGRLVAMSLAVRPPPARLPALR